MPFNNPITGAQGTLVRPAIKSANFVSGSAGWSINTDGTAEFNEGVFRGPVIIGTAPGQGAMELGLTPTSTPGIPAVLLNFNIAYTWYVANIFWINGTDFFFTALVHNSVGAGTMETVSGVYTTAFGVQLQQFVEGDSANTINWGSSTYDTAPLAMTWRNSTVTFDGTTTVAVNNGLSVSNGVLLTSESAANVDALATKVTGDTQNRFVVGADGTLQWGSGSATQDVGLFRSAATVAGLSGSLATTQAAATTVGVSTKVTGDANDRFEVRSDGRLRWGNGTGSVDTIMYRSAAATLASDGIVANVAGSAETWHTATLSGGWTGTLRYRLLASPAAGVQISSGNLTPGTKADGTTVLTLPAGYRPATATDLVCAVNAMAGATAQSPHFAIATTGVVTCWGWGSATGGSVNGIIPTD